MNRNAKFAIGGLVGVVVLVAAYFGAGGGLQGKISLREEVPVIDTRESNSFEREFASRDNEDEGEEINMVRGPSAAKDQVSVLASPDSPSGSREIAMIDAPISIFKVCSNNTTIEVGAINLWLESNSASINPYAYKGNNYLELYTDNESFTDNVGITGSVKVNGAVPSTVDVTFSLSEPLIINKGECKNIKVATNTYYGLVDKANFTDDLFVTIKQLYSDQDATQNIKTKSVSSSKLNY